MKHPLTLLMVLLFCQLAFAGDINPPAPPASTMKTLDEIEPAIPLGQADFPKPITESGSYYLAEDVEVTSAGHGFSIYADNVVIDFRGHSLVGTNISGYAGIYIYDAANVDIKNGSVKNFNTSGISSGGTTHSVRIVNMTIADNPGLGLRLVGGHHLVQGCTITGNGNSFPGDAYGIYCQYGQSRIIDNVIAYNGTGCSGGHAYGIYCGNNTVLKGNVVRGNFYSSTSDDIYLIKIGHNCIIAENTINHNFDSSTAAVTISCLNAGLFSSVYNNNVSDNGSSAQAEEFYAMAIAGSSTINDNIICHNGSSAVISDYLYGLKADNAVVENNTIYNNGELMQGGGHKYGVYMGYYGVIKNNTIVDNGGSSGDNLVYGFGCVVKDNVAP